jgi:DNA-binding NtrC family response regulator
MRVLIADDEERYRDYLRAVLAESGHVVSTVDSGRVAIDHGVRFRPNVLVADWMLRNRIHGLQVAEVLQAVDPALQTILITGFASADLKREARAAGVFEFIEKPFELREMVEIIESACAERSRRRSSPQFAIFQVDSRGAIVNASAKARRVLATTKAGRNARRLEELFGDDAITYLVESNERWTQVELASRRRGSWWVRSRTWPDGGILVLLHDSERHLQGDVVLQMLLDTEGSRKVTWPFAEHVLVVDNVKKSRTLCAELLTQAGCVCYKAESPELALKLFRADPHLGVVILDYAMPSGSVSELLDTFRALRPDVRVVGTAATDRSEEFSALGVERYLERGWDISDLVATLGS